MIYIFSYGIDHNSICEIAQDLPAPSLCYAVLKRRITLMFQGWLHSLVYYKLPFKASTSQEVKSP
jgi:hypothetical protein